MKKKTLELLIGLLPLLIISCSNTYSNRSEKLKATVEKKAVDSTKIVSENNVKIEISSFSKALKPIKYVLPSEDGVWNWGMAPIYDEKGKLHVFVSIIPHNGNWVKNSKIAHFVADKAEGPYTFVEYSLYSDECTYHNPQVSKVGDTYVLVFLMNEYNEGGSYQEIGMATTKSLDKLWVENPNNPIISAKGIMNGASIIHASNPTFVVTPEGEYRIYFKSMTDDSKYREISMATSNRLEGPYINYEKNPVISYADKKVDLEDPYAFYYNGMYYMITEDRTGVVNLLEGSKVAAKKIKPGGNRPGLIYKSKDGIDWGTPQISYLTNSDYFGESLGRSERPNILWKNGKPEYLFLACHDKYSTAGYILKIINWEGE